MKAQLFKKAHELAKEFKAANAHLSYRDCFACALKDVYADAAAKPAETRAERIARKLEALGFSAWEKYGKKRYYINPDQLHLVCEFEAERDRRGCLVTLDGYALSPKLTKALNYCKLYFDVQTERWVFDTTFADKIGKNASGKWDYASIRMGAREDVGGSLADLVRSELCA